ncbi:MAG: hypothetical protein ACMG6E_03700 [Candidatus Roizmanbacteria bacterium]
MENCIIFAETTQGHVFKALAEFYHSAFANIILHVHSKGIKAKSDNSNDEPATILADLNLNGTNFLHFHIPDDLRENPEATLPLCMEARMLRDAAVNIRKKDRLRLFVTKDEPEMLKIAISNSEKDRSAISSIPLLKFEDMLDKDKNPSDICTYSEASPNSTCIATELQKACKAGGQNKSARIRVLAQKSGVQFQVEGSSGVGKSFFFGRWASDTKPIYQKVFTAKGVMDTVSKCCSMTTNCKIFCEGNKPCRFSLDCGSLGTLEIYLVHIKVSKAV